MTEKSSDRSPIQTAARLLGCKPEEILSFRITADGGLSVIAPSGHKLTFTPVQVKQAGGFPTEPRSSRNKKKGGKT